LEDNSKKAADFRQISPQRLTEVVELLDRQTFDLLLSGDPENLLEITSRLDALFLVKLRFLASASQYLISLPPQQRTSVARKIAERIDGREIARSLESVIHALRLVLEEDPQIRELISEKIADFLDAPDFGKLRVGITAASENLFALVEQAVERIAQDPVTVANLVGIVPPLVNGFLRVTSHLAKSLSLPEEVLASAIFNIILAINTEVLADLINGLSAKINEIHTGNVILGGDEREFRKVSYDFLVSLTENIDIDSVSNALIALGEDASDFFESIIRVISVHPEVASSFARALVEIQALTVKAASSALEELSGLPDSFFEETVSHMREFADPSVIARLANNVFILLDRMYRADKMFHYEFASKVIDDLDLGNIASVSSEFIGAYVNTLASRIFADGLFSPEKGSEIVNEALKRYDEAAKSGKLRGELLPRFFAGLDKDELARASSNVCSAMWNAYERDPEKFTEFLKPFLLTGFKIVWKSLIARLKKISKTIVFRKNPEV